MVLLPLKEILESVLLIMASTLSFVMSPSFSIIFKLPMVTVFVLGLHEIFNHP